jgi:hypothetical protein
MDAAGVLGGGDLAQLVDALAALGSTMPRLVFQKKLLRSDVNLSQSRLLLRRTDNRLTPLLTAKERDNAERLVRCSFHERRKYDVPAYDHHGRRYDMELVYLDSVVHYRLCGYGWNRFVKENHLKDALAAAKQMGRKLEVEGWAFRSKELGPNGAAEDDGHHPDGALGFAILVKDIEA